MRGGPVIAALALPLALAGCGEGKREPAGEPAGATPAPPTAAEARATFCQRVFAVKTVGQIVGVNRFEPVPPSRALEPGVGECVYAASGGATAGLAVDCRPEHPRLEQTRQAYAGLTGYREVDVGRGAIYTFDSIGPIHRLVVFSERPSCAAFVSTSGVPDDTTLALARHVVEQLTPPPPP